MQFGKIVSIVIAGLLFAGSVIAEDYADIIVQKHRKAVSFDVASKKVLKTAGCNNKQIASITEARGINISDIGGSKKLYLLVSSDEETTEDDLTTGPLSNMPSSAELKKLLGQKYCVDTFE